MRRIVLLLVALFLAGCAVYVPPVEVGGLVVAPVHDHGHHHRHHDDDDDDD